MAASAPVPTTLLAPALLQASELEFARYEHRLEQQYLPAIRALISKDLSEPYSIYVYRYFLYQWSHLCFMVRFLCDVGYPAAVVPHLVPD